MTTVYNQVRIIDCGELLGQFVIAFEGASWDDGHGVSIDGY